MKNWRKNIIEGMKLIKKGCAEQDSWFGCEECPLAKYCIVSPDIPYPEDWKIEEE